MARDALAKLPADDPERARLHEAAALLARLLLQDIERRADGARLQQGVSPDRVVSVHDPEMRHGRKSATRRFDGHKAAVAVDPESQLITAAEVLPGNAQDHEQALELVEQAEANAGVSGRGDGGRLRLRRRRDPPDLRRRRADAGGEGGQQARRPTSPKTTSGSTWRR